jgi:hypothetical protein
MRITLTLAGVFTLCLNLPLAAQPARPQPPQQPQGKRPSPEMMLQRFDKNNDGKLSKEECPPQLARQFDQLDADKNGMLDKDELAKARPGNQRPAGKPGEIITPAAKGERIADKLEAGMPAPDFTLPELHGTREITLSSFKGKKPVVLIFASYT